MDTLEKSIGNTVFVVVDARAMQHVPYLGKVSDVDHTHVTLNPVVSVPGYDCVNGMKMAYAKIKELGVGESDSEVTLARNAMARLEPYTPGKKAVPTA
jgi:hypothetical protein